MLPHLAPPSFALGYHGNRHQTFSFGSSLNTWLKKNLNLNFSCLWSVLTNKNNFRPSELSWTAAIRTMVGQAIYSRAPHVYIYLPGSATAFPLKWTASGLNCSAEFGTQLQVLRGQTSSPLPDTGRVLSGGWNPVWEAQTGGYISSPFLLHSFAFTSFLKRYIDIQITHFNDGIQQVQL